MFLQSNLDKLIHRMEELNLTFEELADKSEVPLDIVHMTLNSKHKFLTHEAQYALGTHMDAYVKAMDLKCYYIHYTDNNGSGFHVIRPTLAYALREKAQSEEALE